jgi:hypothetical protein
MTAAAPEIFSRGGAHRATHELSVGEVLAWRVWRVEFLGGHPQLYSYSHHVRWPFGPLEADQLPSLDNSHGIYALKTYQDMVSYVGSHGHDGSHVLGQVHLWGLVIEGERGYRAQFAEPVALISILCTRNLDHRPTYGREIEWRPAPRPRYEANNSTIRRLRQLYTPNATEMTAA